MREPPAEEPRRWALLVGIDEYVHMPAWRLEGAVRDVEAFEILLRERWSLPPERIRKLTNAAASREGIRRGFDWLAERVSENDVVVIVYSGHGSWRPDAETSKRRADGREKTLVPSDSGRGLQPSRDIGGDELYDRLRVLTRTTPYVTVILDCCHSGTATRTGPELRPRHVEPDLREDVGAGFRSSSPRRTSAPAPQSGWLPPNDDANYTLIAACRSHQAAYELELPEAPGAKAGILSHFLLRQLENAHAETTSQDLVDALTQDVNAYFRDRSRSGGSLGRSLQEPQVEGARDRQVFGRATIPTMRYLEVLERTGPREVLIAGGAVHGLRTGEVLDVYPPGTKESAVVDFEGGLRRRIELVDVGSVRSSARILRERGGRPVEAGDRAVPWGRSPARYVRRQTLLGLENPGSSLEGKVRFQLKRKNRDGFWISIPAEETPTFRFGEEYAFEITNESPEPVYAYVLDLGLGGGVRLLYPRMAGAREALKPGRAVEVGTRRETCRFEAPKGGSEDPIGGMSSNGRTRRTKKALKIILTTEATDYRIFLREETRQSEMADRGDWTAMLCHVWLQA